MRLRSVYQDGRTPSEAEEDAAARDALAHLAGYYAAQEEYRELVPHGEFWLGLRVAVLRHVWRYIERRARAAAYSDRRHAALSGAEMEWDAEHEEPYE